MASEGGQQEASPVQDPVRPLDVRQPSSAAVDGSEVVVAQVEQALAELLRRYQGALKFAANMPAFGRCEVSGAKVLDVTVPGAKVRVEKQESDPLIPWRWAARFYARLYVETHVRKHLQTILAQLRLELLGMTASKDRDRVVALEADLAGKVEPLLGWRRIAGIITRLPLVAAALPLLLAAAVHSVGGTISAQTVRHTVVVFVEATVVIWVVVVWPSIRLGFRIKRAIFCGGRDLRHPLFNAPGGLQWKGFANRKQQHMTWQVFPKINIQDFPEENIYDAENALYRTLGRRKPSEVPIDMLLSLAPYLLFAVSALVVFGAVQTVASGDVPASFWFELPVAALIVILPFQVVFLQARRNYRSRWR
jgi:hypothetical protein